MFKLVVLSALVAVALAAPKPGLVAAPALAYSAPVVAHSVVGSVPTSISAHSSSVVHSHAVHAAPVVAAYAAPAVPAVHHVAAVPAAVSTYSTHGLVNTYGAHVAPVAYGIHGVHGVHVL